VDQDADPVGAEDHERVRMQLHHPPGDRRQHGRRPGLGVDGEPRPDHLGLEDRVA